jgi:hypothetical protein
LLLVLITHATATNSLNIHNSTPITTYLGASALLTFRVTGSLLSGLPGALKDFWLLDFGTILVDMATVLELTAISNGFPSFDGFLGGGDLDITGFCIFLGDSTSFLYRGLRSMHAHESTKLDVLVDHPLLVTHRRSCRTSATCSISSRLCIRVPSADWVWRRTFL